MHSCVYEGFVRHRRLAPITHRFDYRICLMYLDLDELPHVFGAHPLWSIGGRGLARFRRRDHLIHRRGSSSLAVTARELIRDRLDRETTGPIRLLTNPEYFGYRFNPVSFYYCFADDGVTLDVIIAEINNTPWGQQHCYVFNASADDSRRRSRRFRFRKDFHISPFMPMQVEYGWSFATPGLRLGVHMNSTSTHDQLNVTMRLQRREISRASLGRVLWRYPFATARTVGAIYWQALRLWIKKVRYYPHPNSPWVRSTSARTEPARFSATGDSLIC